MGLIYDAEFKSISQKTSTLTKYTVKTIFVEFIVNLHLELSPTVLLNKEIFTNII